MSNYNKVQKECISCNGTGKIECNCGGTSKNPSNCLACFGQGDFICPVCDGNGEF